MKDVKTYDLLKEVIQGMSSRFNKKALNEVIENFNHNRYDLEQKLNIILKDYYERIHKRSKEFYEFINIENQDDLDYIKEAFGAKRYKRKYDYTKKPYPIKQQNTGLAIERNNGFMSFVSYAFDVYRYVEAQNYNVVDL